MCLFVYSPAVLVSLLLCFICFPVARPILRLLDNEPLTCWVRVRSAGQGPPVGEVKAHFREHPHSHTPHPFQPDAWTDAGVQFTDRCTRASQRVRNSRFGQVVFCGTSLWSCSHRTICSLQLSSGAAASTYCIGGLFCSK